jgi:signal peptidase II
MQVVTDAPASTGRRYGLLVAIAAFVVLLDQVTKHWALRALADGPIWLVGDDIGFHLTFNTGSAFSLFQGGGWVFVVIAIVAVAGIAWALRGPRGTLTVVCCALVAGGALGNLVDRLFRDPGFPSGRVVDFLDVGPWPVFNVADSAITIAVVVLLVASWRGERRADA